MRETKAYKTYVGYATGATPPKKVRKFKKPTSPKLTTVPVSLEEPTRKLKRVKRPAKKSTKVLIGESLTEEAQYKEVHKKSLRDFQKTHPSGSGTVTKIAPSAAKIKPSVTNKGTGAKPGVPNVTEEESTESEAKSWGKDEDDSNNDHDSRSEGIDQERDSGDDNTQFDSERGSYSEHETDENETGSESDQEEIEEEIEDDEEEEEDEFVKTPSNDIDDEDETKIKDKAEVHVLVITDSSPVYSTVIPQSLPSFTPPPQQSTLTPPSIIEATNPPSALPNFASFFQFNNRVTSLKKEVAELKKGDPLNTQVTDLILPKEVSNFSPLEIQRMVTESLEHAFLAKDSSQPKLSYEAAASLIEFELKKILIDKMDESQSYLTSTEHKECYDGLIKFYDLDKSLFPTYDKVYSLKRSQNDKDKDEDPSVGSDRGLMKRKTSKDAEPTKGPKAKESNSGSSKGAKSQSTSSGKFAHAKEPEFEVVESDMPQDKEENLGNDDEEPERKVASKKDWFTKPKQFQEPTDPDWNVGKTPQQGPTQSWLMTLASSADKPSKTFDELMSTPIYFSAYIMNGLKITNLTQETLLGPAFKLLKGTRTSYAELEYDFEECYKALSEKLDWDNPEGSDYPFDLTKPLSLVMNGNRQMVSVDYFFNNDLKYLQGGISTMTYTTSITKTKATQYDPPGIEDMEGDFPRLRINDIEDMLILIVQNRLTNLLGNDVSIFAIALGMFTRSMVIQKRVEDLQLGVESYQKKINVTKPETTRPSLRKKDPYTPYQDPQGFIYVDTQGRNRLMRDELYKFSDDTLTRL
ncbi:hypothetical protein Tco_1449861 [Tanacetum coccineum]